ncbi:hypothetical protein [Nostoc favosum]|uniref:Uncharacterized protein n=1 Tax=Nostoc favosum CHAB5714 TaxID=2780399 RepID=A0ABS8II11_9NOSO|nr:hypothetical protein [Nostoc favosum]MCC5603566.1 hypothetical protein [Nostoc favosum CHAB5714]
MEQKNTGSQFYAIAAEILPSIIGICQPLNFFMGIINFDFPEREFMLSGVETQRLQELGQYCSVKTRDGDSWRLCDDLLHLCDLKFSSKNLN